MASLLCMFKRLLATNMVLWPIGDLVATSIKPSWDLWHFFAIVSFNGRKVIASQSHCPCTYQERSDLVSCCFHFKNWYNFDVRSCKNDVWTKCWHWIFRCWFAAVIIYYMGRVKRFWYLSPMRAAKVQASLRIRAVSPEPPLLAHTSSESWGTFRQKARSLAPLNGWACAVKICHDGMLEDTNSLDAAHIVCQYFLWSSCCFWSFNNRLLIEKRCVNYQLLAY